MKKIMMACAFLTGALLCLGQHAVAAESECNVFGASRWGGEQTYQNCGQCLQQNNRCEKRCFDTNSTCTAVGYDSYGFRSTVQGPQARKERRARKKAVRQCEQQGLRSCAVDRCTKEKALRPESVEVCRSQPVVVDPPYRGRGRDRNRDRNRNWERENSTEYRCGIFPKSPQAPQREYPSCEACVQANGQCEERCAESGYACTAVGSGRRGFEETIQGDLANSRQRAERRVMRKCYNAGLNGCALGQCSETMRFDPSRVTPCQTQTVIKKKNNKKNNKKKNKKKKSPPRVAPQPTKKYVTSWQHIKGKCQGRSSPKVAQQCGNRGFWHGISCQVTWSDGSTQNLHGKVDLADPYGRAYCTRSTRPARFNCVSRCDNSNGPQMSLPRP
jgi:hypothetical protein